MPEKTITDMVIRHMLGYVLSCSTLLREVGAGKFLSKVVEKPHRHESLSLYLATLLPLMSIHAFAVLNTYAAHI